MKFIEHYITAAVLFVLIDSVWLTIVANKYYKSQMKSLLREKPNFVPAVLFYLIYMYALVFFVINPSLADPARNITYALGHGALLGLAMYATYDLTNHSTLKGWPAKITYLDLAWGTTITTIVSVLSYLIFK